MRNMALAGVVICLAASLPAADAPSMSVFFTETKGETRPDVDDATKNALKKKKDEASKARKALEKQLKGELGKKRETWPPEKDTELYALEEAEAMAEADYQYRKIDPKAIGDAVEDVVRAAQGKGLQAGKKDHIVVAESAADADLVVEVLARRSQKELGAVIPSHCWLLFSIGPGPKTTADQFALPATYRVRKFLSTAWKVAAPTPEKPVFTFESYNGGGTPVGCHGTAANAAAGLVDKFIEDHHQTLKGK